MAEAEGGKGLTGLRRQPPIVDRDLGDGLVLPKVMWIAVTVLTVLRPILNLEQPVKRASGQWSGYLGVAFSRT